MGGDVAAEQGTKFPRQLSQEGEAGAEAAQRAAPKRKTEEPRGTKRSLAGHEPDDESRAQETRDPGEGSIGEALQYRVNILTAMFLWQLQRPRREILLE